MHARIWGAGACLILALGAGLAAETLGDLLRAVAGKSLQLDTAQRWYFNDPAWTKGAGRTETILDLNYGETAGVYTVDFKYPNARLSLSFSPQGRLVGLQQEGGPELSKIFGFERKSATVSAGMLLTRTFLGGMQKSEKTLAYGSNVAEMQTIPYLLLALLQNSQAGSFNCDLIIAQNAIYNADFRRIDTGQVLKITDRYRFPDKFRASLPEGFPYIVYEMGLTGLPGLVYPHKSYFVFRDDPSKAYVAMWGGDPSQAQFAARLK